MDRVHQNKPYQLSSPQLDPRVDICYTTLKYIIAAQSRAGSFKKNWCTAASSTAICLCKERASYCRQHMPLDRVSLNVFVLSQLVHHLYASHAWCMSIWVRETWNLEGPTSIYAIDISFVRVPICCKEGTKPCMLQPHHTYAYDWNAWLDQYIHTYIHT